MNLERLNCVKNPVVLPRDEYMHYIVIWANYLSTWFYFSLFPGLKNNSKTPKLRKRTEKTTSMYSLNREDVKPAPAERALSGRKRSAGPLKQTRCTPHQAGERPTDPWRLGGFRKGEHEGTPPWSTSREKNSSSDQNRNIPKRKATENRKGLQQGWWGDTLP